jgi:hypothetical protein
MIESREARPFVRRSYWRGLGDLVGTNLRAMLPWTKLAPLPARLTSERADVPGVLRLRG